MTLSRTKLTTLALIAAFVVGCDSAPATGAVDAAMSTDTGRGATDSGTAADTAPPAIDSSTTTDSSILDSAAPSADTSVRADAAPTSADAAPGDAASSRWVCRRTASISCDCQDGGDPTTFPHPDCSNMADGMRFCAAATHLISGRQIPICQCYRMQTMIDSLKATWTAAPSTYENVRDTGTCPPQ